MVFVNNFNKEIILVNYLRKLLPLHMKKDTKWLITIFSSILKPNIKIDYLKNFYNGNTKIWTYINIAKMGNNIRNIVQIVSLKISAYLILALILM